MDPKSVLLGLREKSVGLSKAQTRIPWREIIMRVAASSASLKEQAEYADKFDIPVTCRLGQGQLARESCTNICDLIGHPLISGDTLIVYNLALVGRTYNRIMEVIDTFHKHRIPLKVVDIDYFDPVRQAPDFGSENDDYRKLSLFLRAIEREHQYKKVTSLSVPDGGKRKPGRPRKDWNSLPREARELVIKHCKSLGVYTAANLRDDLSSLGYPIGSDTLNNLIAECKRFVLKGSND